MKYLVSILMVLLMVNFFAQAQSADTATPAAEGATAKSIEVGDIAKIVKPGDAYNDTLKGRNEVKGVQGKMQDCEQKDAFGRCNPSPNSKTLITNKNGMNGSKGQGDPAAKPAPSSNAEKANK